MSIGLYDQDMATYTLVPYNLELMKLATYYKNRREIVVLSKKFEPYRFEKFFLHRSFFTIGKFWHAQKHYGS